MYTVVEVKGHQYRVQPGDLIDVQLMSEEEGSEINLQDVYFVGGENPIIGKPVVEGASVKAKVLRHDRDRKILMMKRKPRGWLKRRGHRQHYTCLLITEVNDGKGNVVTIEKDSKVAQKYLK